MNNYNKIYSAIEYLKYTVDTENISLVCIIEKSKKDGLIKRQYYTGKVFLNKFNIFKNEYDVMLYSNGDKFISLDRCIEDLELFIKHNFVIK